MLCCGAPARTPSPPVSTLNASDALAEEIANNAPLPVQVAKTIINHILGDEPIPMEDQELFARMRDTAAASHDLREGRQTFLENRKAHFTGC